jgi:hypothetical protein
VGVRVVASEAAASREGRRDYSCDGDMERRRVSWSEGEGEGELRVPEAEVGVELVY